jgi:N-acetylmuramoyl-L-alanine amidase
MPGSRRLVAVVVLAVVPVAMPFALTGCATPAPAVRPSAPLAATATPPATSRQATAPARRATSTPSASGAGTTASSRPPAAGALAHAVVVLDPGHDGGNAGAPAAVDRLVDIGTGRKACDTVGAETAGGYAEHAFSWDLARRLAARLRAAGARVVLTRDGDTGVGPCITERAVIGNRAARDATPGTPVVALSLHADGGPPGGVGFHVIEPLPVAGNSAVVEPSRRLGAAVRRAFRRGTGEPVSTYTGTDGVTRRDDLGGLNLSRIPKVFVECGNMRNPRDASRLTDPAWRERAAAALVEGLQQYLEPPG